MPAVVYGEPPAPVNDADALGFLWAMLGAAGVGFHVIVPEDPEAEKLWLPVSDVDGFMRAVPDYGWRDCTLSAVPLEKRGSFLRSAPSGCVWARTSTPAQATALRRFNPVPSLVLRDGRSARYTAFWSLLRPLDADDAERVGKHLAHKLGALKKWAAPSFRFRPPGCVDRSRARPVPIVVAGGSSSAYSVGQVCRTLPREIPDPESWRRGY